MSRKFYTTVEVAKTTGVKRSTLQHWIKTGRISAPRVLLVDGKAVRLWTEDQVEQVRQLMRLKTAFIDPKVLARIREAAKKSWADPKGRARRAAGLKKLWATPEMRARLSAAARRSWADPKVRARRAAALKRRRDGEWHTK